MEKEKFCKTNFGIKPSYPDTFYPKDQLEKGMRIELEHIDQNLEPNESPEQHLMNAIAMAKCIAKNHLDEQRESGEEMNYYDLLAQMEKQFTPKEK